MQGRGSKQVFNAPFEQVWSAAVDAAQIGDLEVVTADRERGYIGTRRGLHVHTPGENVGIWVTRLGPAETQVEVVSRLVGPPPQPFVKNWEDEVLRAVSANLTRETPAVGVASPPAGTIQGESTVPSDTSRPPARLDTERQLQDLRREEELRQEEMLREQNEERRQELREEIERLRSELNRVQQRLSEMEREEQPLR